jgi:tetratricopeptide (TPR) repeat protein
VLRACERVRITAQLIEAADDRNLWGESFEGDHRDIVALQNEVTREIAREIKLNLNPADRERLAVSQQVDPEAHADYLRGRFHWSKRTMEGFTRALGHFRRAIARDPNYAPAYVGLADSYTMLADYDWLPPRQAAENAKAAIAKALEIDDSLAEAHTSLADIRRFYDWDWAGAEKEYKRGIELNPKYITAHQWYAEFLAGMGRREEAIREIRLAEELDPLSVVVKGAAGWVFFFVRDYDEAIENCERVIEMDPGFGEVYSQLRRAYEQKRMYSEALAADEKLRAFKKKTEPRASVSQDASVLQSATTYWQSLLLLTEADLENAQTRDGAQFRMAEIFTQLGETKQALEWLEKAFQTRSFWMPFLAVHPHLDPLRGDPRFEDLLRRVGHRK